MKRTNPAIPSFTVCLILLEASHTRATDDELVPNRMNGGALTRFAEFLKFGKVVGRRHAFSPRRQKRGRRNSQFPEKQSRRRSLGFPGRDERVIPQHGGRTSSARRFSFPPIAAGSSVNTI